MEAFLGQLAALAGSPLAGALQSTYGRLVSPISRSASYNEAGEDLASQDEPLGSHLVLSRFERPTQLRGFLELPPCEALVGGQEGLVPVKAVLSAQMQIAPAEKTASSGPDRVGSELGL